MTHHVRFAPEAEEQLVALQAYIADEASLEIASRYTDAILERCELLTDFPKQGSPREDVRPGLRTIVFRRRVVIAYAVDGQDVTILGFFYGGQQFDDLPEDGEPPL